MSNSTSCFCKSAEHLPCPLTSHAPEYGSVMPASLQTLPVPLWLANSTRSAAGSRRSALRCASSVPFASPFVPVSLAFLLVQNPLVTSRRELFSPTLTPAVRRRNAELPQIACKLGEHTTGIQPVSVPFSAGFSPLSHDGLLLEWQGGRKPMQGLENTSTASATCLLEESMKRFRTCNTSAPFR